MPTSFNKDPNWSFIELVIALEVIVAPVMHTIAPPSLSTFKSSRVLSINCSVLHFFPLKGLSVDEDGNIFVCTFEKGQKKNSYIYDVFEPQGKYITRVPLKPMPDTLLFWKKRKLYTIEEDEEGYQYVKRYKITWNY